MLTTIIVFKALLEIAGLALLGRGLLSILAGAKREQNIFYQVLVTMTRPLIRAVRFITPRFVLDQHIGALAFFIIVMFWFTLIVEVQVLCLEDLRHQSCGRLAVEYVNRCEAGVEEACAVLEHNGIHGTPAQ